MEGVAMEISGEMRILVVDDVKVHLSLMRAGLRRIDPFMIVDLVESIAEAQGSMAENSYDAVICDWMMPGGGGHDLLEWMRKRPHYAYVPFVMMSARDENDDVIKAFVEFGVDDYVVKPFTPDVVYQKVTAAIVRVRNKRVLRRGES